MKNFRTPSIRKNGIFTLDGVYVDDVASTSERCIAKNASYYFSYAYNRTHILLDDQGIAIVRCSFPWLQTITTGQSPDLTKHHLSGNERASLAYEALTHGLATQTDARTLAYPCGRTKKLHNHDSIHPCVFTCKYMDGNPSTSNHRVEVSLRSLDTMIARIESIRLIVIRCFSAEAKFTVLDPLSCLVYRLACITQLMY